MLKKLIRHKQKQGGVSYSQAASIPVSNVAEPAAPKPATVTTTPVISKGRNLDLHVLHVPQPPCENVVDIVFVHGVTGNAYDTWRHHGSDTHWPSNLLQNDIPNARIMAWGYDADVVSFWGHAGRNRLGEHAKNLMGDVVRLREDTDTEARNIFFVCHSLGGLVVQKALCVSRDQAEPHLRRLETCTAGIIFLGTPHNGSDLAAWAVLGTRLISKFRDANVDIMRTLERDSEVLRDTQDTFGQLLKIREGKGSGIQVTCFFEENAVTGVGVIVPISSACLFGYSSYGIPGNHMDMARFATAEELGYRRILGELKRCVKRTIQDTESRQGPRISSSQEEILHIIAFKGALRTAKTTKRAMPDTSSWLWTDTRINFLEWVRSRRSLFWITGHPGSGKSTIMDYLATNRSRIFEALNSSENITSLSTKPIFAIYFLDSQAETLQRSLEGLLRSLIHQILLQQPQLFTNMFPSIGDADQFRDTFLPWSQWQLETVLRDALEARQTTPFLVFIDGLDECEGDSSVVAKFIRSFAERAPPNLKMCVSSRPYADFEFEFRDCPMFRVEKYTSEDIHAYVHKRFEEAQPVLGSHCDFLAQKVTDKARGVFLWVTLVCDSLQRGWRRYEEIESLESRLREMPQDLVDLYQRILDEMDPREQEEAQRMLIIVALAKRTLFLPELFHGSFHSAACMTAWSTNNCIQESSSGIGSLRDQREILRRFEGRVKAVCRGLIQVHVEPGQGSSVILLHETVHSFVRQRILGKTSDTTLIPQLNGSLFLLHACIHYLSSLLGSTEEYKWTLQHKHPDKWSEEQTDYFELGSVLLNYRDYLEQVELNKWNTLHDYPLRLGFLHYAVEHWLDHAFDAEIETRSSNESIIDKIAGPYFDLWRRIFQIHNPTRARKMPTDKLALALEAGLERYAESQVRELDSRPLGGSAAYSLKPTRMYPNYLLFATAKKGSTRVADILLQKGACLQPEPGFSRGVRFLPPVPNKPKTKVEFGSLRHWGQGAFARAVHFDQAELVELFIARGGSMETKTLVPLTPQWLETGGIIRMRVLAQSAFFADANSTSLRRSRRTVKGEKVFSGSEDGSQTRFQEGFTGLQLIDRYYGDCARDGITPYHPPHLGVYKAITHAVERKSYRVLTTLLTISRAGNIQHELDLALIRATELGIERCVTVLLEYGADARFSSAQRCSNTRPSCYALLAAVDRGDVGIVSALLRAGFDPNFTSPCCRRRSVDLAVERLSRYPNNSVIQAVVIQVVQHGGCLPKDILKQHSISNNASLRTWMIDNLNIDATDRTHPSKEQQRIPSEQMLTRSFSFDFSRDQDTEEAVQGLVSLR